VQEFDPPEEDAVPARHRAAGSVAGKASVRLGIAALGVLLTTGLGVVTADVLGLNEVGEEASEGSSLRPFPVAADEEPRPRGTVDVPARPAPPPVEPPVESPPADQSGERPARAAAAAPADAPPPASAGGGGAPPPVRTVRTGASCPVVGQTAVTNRGTAAVCTASRGNGRNKWRGA
jgi:hypothetical protein